jgi:hypothetical protein
MAKSIKDEMDYHTILLELIKLRDTDYDGFMNKLYEALNGRFRNAINDTAPAGEKRQAIWSMIEHFSAKEEYEKCADLKRLVEELEIKKI